MFLLELTYCIQISYQDARKIHEMAIGYNDGLFKNYPVGKPRDRQYSPHDIEEICNYDR